MQRIRHVLLISAMVICSMMVGLGALETMLYFTYRDVQIGGGDSPSTWTFRKRYYHLNSRGFRDKEVDVRKPADVGRILVLGDSFSFGAGIKRAEDTYPALLDHKLGPEWEVINSGVRGWSTADELAFLKSEGLALKPDLLIVGHVLNDAETPELKEAKVRRAIKSWLIPQGLHIFLMKSSFTYYLSDRSIRGLVDNWGRSSDQPTGHDAYLHAIHQEPNWRDYARIVADLAAVAKSQDLPVIWMSFPNIRHAKAADYPFEQVRRKLRDLAVGQGFHYLDLYEPLRATEEETLTVSPWDDHPNEAVHAVAASELQRMMVAERFLDGPSPGKGDHLLSHLEFDAWLQPFLEQPDRPRRSSRAASAVGAWFNGRFGVIGTSKNRGRAWSRCAH